MEECPCTHAGRRWARSRWSSRWRHAERRASDHLTTVTDSRACVDARLDLAQDNMARATIEGDSIFAVEQAIVELEARTFVKHYVIDRSTCDWIPTGWRRR